MLGKIKAIQKTYDKVTESVQKMMALYSFRDENKAFVLLRATLKALRDRLSTEEAIQLGSQLPALLRGFYYEGWNLELQSVSRTKKAFIQDVRYHLNGHEDINLQDAIPAAMKVILDMIDQGEAVEVLHQLPREVQELCPD